VKMEAILVGYEDAQYDTGILLSNCRWFLVDVEVLLNPSAHSPPRNAVRGLVSNSAREGSSGHGEHCARAPYSVGTVVLLHDKPASTEALALVLELSYAPSTCQETRLCCA